MVHHFRIFVFLLSAALLSYSFRLPGHPRRRSAQLRMTVSEPDPVVSIEEEVLRIVDMCLETVSQTPDLGALLEGAHLLAKDDVYEQIIDAKLKNCKTPEEAQNVNRVNAFLKGFVVTERKSRSRLKVNYLIAGATSGRLEESVMLLSETDEIDVELLEYLDSLIKKELLRQGGPAATLRDQKDLPQVFTSISSVSYVGDIIRLIVS